MRLGGKVEGKKSSLEKRGIRRSDEILFNFEKVGQRENRFTGREHVSSEIYVNKLGLSCAKLSASLVWSRPSPSLILASRLELDKKNTYSYCLKPKAATPSLELGLGNIPGRVGRVH